MPVVAEPGIEEEKDEIVPRLMAAPEAPALAERLAHEVTHLPFKSWCEICVASTSQGPQHLRADPEVRVERLEADETLQDLIDDAGGRQGDVHQQLGHGWILVFPADGGKPYYSNVAQHISQYKKPAVLAEADMEDVEEMDEAHGDSEDDAHDPVSVDVRYATRGPARTPDASPGRVPGTRLPRVGRTNRRASFRL